MSLVQQVRWVPNGMGGSIVCVLVFLTRSSCSGIISEDDPLPEGETQAISYPSATEGIMWPWYNIIKIQKARPSLNKTYTQSMAGRGSVLNKCLLNGCNGILLLLFFFFFSESQESAEWFHHKIWPSFLFLGGNEFMPKSLEWTYKDQEAKRSQRQPTEDSNMNKINLSSKTCIQSWENNSSELEKCVKTVK